MSRQPTSIDPFELFSAEMFEERRKAPAPQVKPITRAKLTDLISKHAHHTALVGGTPAMELTARRPHTDAGFMDVLKPGRWDCDTNLVFLDVIVKTGSLGEWEGSVVYARFTAAAAGTYLVLGNFSGYQITANLRGPWGNSTAYCPTVQDDAQAVAVWTAAVGETLFFTATITGPYLGYLQSLQTFLLE